MNNSHKELLEDLLKDWSIEKVENYILQLERKRAEMDEWIKDVKTLRKKKIRKQPVDTGVRGG